LRPEHSLNHARFKPLRKRKRIQHILGRLLTICRQDQLTACPQGVSGQWHGRQEIAGHCRIGLVSNGLERILETLRETGGRTPFGP
jgi:hypothetical protein